MRWKNNREAWLRLSALVVIAMAVRGPTMDAHPERVALAIENATVIPMDGPNTLADHTVVIENGVITAVGPSERVIVPAGATRIDGRGKYLMPGLVNMHAHVVDAVDLPLWIANGVTTIRDLDGRDWTLELRDRIARRELIGPHLIVSSRILYGSEPQWRDTTLTASENAATIVSEIAAAGYDQIKVYFQLSAEQYYGLIDAAAEHGLDVVGHVPWSVGLSGVLASGQTTIEHLTGYDDALEGDTSPVVGQRSQWNEIVRYQHARLDRLPALAKVTQRSGVWNVPTLIVHAKLLPPDEKTISRERGFAPYLRPEVLDDWAERRRRERSADELDAIRTALDVRRRIVAALHVAGAGILAGTDGSVGSPPGFAVHEELELLVEAGLEPIDALRAATANAAAALRDDTFGRVAVGQRADLLLLTGDPTADIANTRSIVGVIAAGAWYDAQDLAALRASLAERFDAERDLLARVRAGDIRPVVDELRSAHAADPESTFREGALLNASRALLDADRTAEALRLLEVVAGAFPESTRAWSTLGAAHVRAGNTTAARTAFERALELDYQNWDAVQGLRGME